jgi:hypothetical protein
MVFQDSCIIVPVCYWPAMVIPLFRNARRLFLFWFPRRLDHPYSCTWFANLLIELHLWFELAQLNVLPSNPIDGMN